MNCKSNAASRLTLTTASHNQELQILNHLSIDMNMLKIVCLSQQIFYPRALRGSYTLSMGSRVSLIFWLLFSRLIHSFPFFFFFSSVVSACARPWCSNATKHARAEECTRWASSSDATHSLLPWDVTILRYMPDSLFPSRSLSLLHFLSHSFLSILCLFLSRLSSKSKLVDGSLCFVALCQFPGVNSYRAHFNAINLRLETEWSMQKVKYFFK